MDGNLEIHAREVGHGSIRAMCALEALLLSDGYFALSNERMMRTAHWAISTFPTITRAYNRGFPILRNGKKPPSTALLRWAEGVEAKGNPVVVLHETLAKALKHVDATVPRFMYAFNALPKPGELADLGLEGVIVRTQEAKRQMIETGHYRGDQVCVATLTHPDIVKRRTGDFARRRERLGYLVGKEEKAFGELDGGLDAAIATSGGGCDPEIIRQILRSCERPLKEGLVNLTLIGNYGGILSPANVMTREALRLGLDVTNTSSYSEVERGLQIVTNDSSRSLVDDSIRLVRMADVMISTSATDLLGYTSSSSQPAVTGPPRGGGELSILEHATRTGIFASRRGPKYVFGVYDDFTNVWQDISHRARKSPSLVENAEDMHRSNEGTDNIIIKRFLYGRLVQGMR